MFKIKFTKTKLLFVFMVSSIVMLLNVNSTYINAIGETNSNKILICDGSDGRVCSIEEGIKVIKNNINDIETEQKASVFIQNIVAALLMFLGFIGVLYVIYAGFNILISSGEESKLKNEKNRIAYVIIGLIVIFLAYSINKTILNVLNDSKTPISPLIVQVYKDSFITKAYALTPKHFDEYVKEMRLLEAELTKEYDLDGELKISTLDKLENIVIGAGKTFPDNDNIVENTKLYTKILTKIEKAKKSPSNESIIQELSGSMVDFKNSIKVEKVKSTITVRPSNEGNAPFAVSFIADASDPSGMGLKNNQNYEWWIKTNTGIKKVVGRKSTLIYTFDTEGTYFMHLKVSSSSRNKYGNMDIIPYEGKVEIKVKPHIAFINLSVEGKNVGNNDLVKLSPEIGARGIVIDASNSQPIEGTKFLETEWDFGNGETKKYKGGPKIEIQRYTKEKAYDISLKILTNEGNLVERQISLDIREPIAEIKSSKEKGFINENFSFNVVTTYGGDNIEYSWKIKKIGSTDNDLVFTSFGDHINYKFKRTGRYVVELKTTTYSGKQDTDSVLVTIDSQEPIANFDLEEKQPETPNIFVFDATGSYDPDYFDTSNLKYNWYINGEEIELSNTERKNAIGEYAFKERGKYIVKLEVIDSDGKIGGKEKNIEITSLLSIDIKTFPKLLKRGKALIAEAVTKYGTTFVWDFGDGSGEEITSIKKIAHKYTESGEYTIKLKTTSNLGEENTTKDKIYVVDSEQPIAIIDVLGRNKSLIEERVCDGKQKGFIIDRTGTFTISAENSINIDGKNDGLTYLWEYKGLKSRDKTLNYKSTEIECFPVTLTIMSTKNKKESRQTVYIDVRNIEPKVDGLSINIEDINKDPAIINIKALNPRDKDGAIVSYLWYYKTDTDPSPQDFQITQTPYTTFVLPKINEKFYFTLVIEDTNGSKFSTDKLSEKYSITLTGDNINTPIVSLNVPDTSVNAGEEVIFNVSAKNILLQDISKNSKYKWDFDGDGFYDRESNVSNITNIYTTPGKYRVKVKVTHKGISNVKYQEIIVSNELIPRLESISIGNKNLILNTSRGSIKSTKWIINRKLLKKCKKEYCIFNGDDYSNKVTAIISDGVNKVTQTINIKKDNKANDNANIIKNSEDKIIIFSYPEISNSEIILDSPLINKVFLYINPIDNALNYLIDNDINSDSDLNGVNDDDIDNKDTLSFKKGEIYIFDNKSTNQKSKQTLRIIAKDESGNIIEKKEINIIRNYIKEEDDSKEETSNELLLSNKDKLHLNNLESIINKLPKDNKLKLKLFLPKLKESWYDEREKTQTILTFERDVISSDIPQDIKNKLIFEVESILIAQSELKGEIGLAVAVIKGLIPKDNQNYETIVGDTEGKISLVSEILSHPTNIDLNKQIGSKILNIIKDDSNIPSTDKFTIKDQILIITSGGKVNIPEKIEPTQPEDTGNGFLGSISKLKTIIKWIAIILSVILGIFIILLIIGFIYYKISKGASETRFQDFIIDFLSGKNRLKDANADALNKKEEERIKAEDLFNTNFNLSQENFTNSSDSSDSSEESKNIDKNTDAKVDTGINTDVDKNTDAKVDTNINANINTNTKVDTNKDSENKPETNDGDIPDWLKADATSKDNKTKDTESVSDSSDSSENLEESKNIDKNTKDIIINKKTSKKKDKVKSKKSEKKIVEKEKKEKGRKEKKKSKAITKIKKSNFLPKKVLDTNKTLVKTEKVDKIKTDDSISNLPDWLKTEAKNIKNDKVDTDSSINENNKVDNLPSWLKSRDEQLNNKS